MPKFTANDFTGTPQTVSVKGRVITQVGSVTLLQQTVYTFAVLYGLELSDGLTYSDAAATFGACIMHENQPHFPLGIADD